MTLAIGFWVLLTGGVMLPGSDDLLAVPPAGNTSDYSIIPNVPSTPQKSTGPTSRYGQGGSGATSRYPTGAMAPRLGPSSYSRSPLSMPRMMPLAPDRPRGGSVHAVAANSPRGRQPV